MHFNANCIFRWLQFLWLSMVTYISKMREFWNKFYKIQFEGYQVSVSHVSSFCLHFKRHGLELMGGGDCRETLSNSYFTHILTWCFCDQHAVTYLILLYMTRTASYIQSKGVQGGSNSEANWEGWLRPQHTKLPGDIPTLTHDSKHYSMETTGRRNIPGLICLLVM